MKTFVLLMISVYTYAQPSYNLFTTTITCPADKIQMTNDGKLKIEFALRSVVKEGQLMDFSAAQSRSKESNTIELTFPCEDQQGFQKLNETWKKISEKTDAEFFKTFWQSCKRKDTIMNNIKVIYPAIKSVWAPVAVVNDLDVKMDPTAEHNIVFDFFIHNKMNGKRSNLDSASINMGLNDIARIYNLHIAGGVPKEKVHFVVAVHAKAETSFFTNEAYQKKYKMNNPNLPLIEQLDKAGVRFLLCGQSHNWFGYKKDQLIPEAKLTVSAQTTLSSFQSKGYALKVLQED